MIRMPFIRKSGFLLVVLVVFVFNPFEVSRLVGQSDGPIEESLLQGLGQNVQEYVSKNYALGAELQVIHNGESVYHESFGVSEPQGEISWHNDTICNIRSMTKPMTSAAAQILIDRGELELDVPVAKYLESFANEKSEQITVRQVLTHRSGLPLTNLMNPYQYKSLEKQVAAAGEKGPEFEPGSKFWYSDLGTDVVAALVAKVSGEPVHVFVKRELLDPLKMENSFYGFDAEDERLSRAASGYIRGGPKGWQRFWKPGKKALYPFAWGSQTIFSTTSDYAKFLTMLMNDGKVGETQLLSKEAVKRMMEPVSRTRMMGSDQMMPDGFRNLETWYGQMLVTYRPTGQPEAKPEIFGHSGSDGTIAWAWPEKDLIILYFTQSRGGMTPLQFEEEIDHWILNRGKLVVEDVPAEVETFLGTYLGNERRFNGQELVVKFRDGKLILDVPSQLPFELLPTDKPDVWDFAVAPKKIQVSFNRESDGRVLSLSLVQGGKSVRIDRKGFSTTTDSESETTDKQLP